jgi:hypothetical protein
MVYQVHGTTRTDSGKDAPDPGTAGRRKLRLRVATAFAALLLAAPLATLTAGPAQAQTTVPVRLSGSPCYTGGSLAFWRLVVDDQISTGNIYGTSTHVGLSPGSHYFIAQAWCKYLWVVGAGRSGTMHAWVYSSGYQPTVTVFAGLYY